MKLKKTWSIAYAILMYFCRIVQVLYKSWGILKVYMRNSWTSLWIYFSGLSGGLVGGWVAGSPNLWWRRRLLSPFFKFCGEIVLELKVFKLASQNDSTWVRLLYLLYHKHQNNIFNLFVMPQNVQNGVQFDKSQLATNLLQV